MIDNDLSAIVPQGSQMSNLQAHPSLLGGYSLLFDETVPVELQYVDYDRNVNQIGNQEQVNFKIYTAGSKPNIGRIKMEIQSENDPFFLAHFECDQNLFNIMKKEQALDFSLQDLPTVLLKCLNRAKGQGNRLTANLLVHSDGKSRLKLSQASEFKNVEVIRLDLNQQGDEQLEEVIKFKYEALRKKIERAEGRLSKIDQIIREKNPSLLLQIVKARRQ